MRRRLHGVRITAAPGPSEELFRALLDLLAPDGGDGPPDLEIAVGASERPVPAEAGGRGIFVHGSLRGWEQDGAVRVADGASAVVISADGRRLTGAVYAPAGGVRFFEHELLAMAVAIALRSHGLYHVHGATLVAPDGTAVLVPGAGGAGKTTLTLALAAAGFTPVSDDLCFLARSGGAPVLVPVPRAFHVAERTARAFPALGPLLGGPVASGKRELDPRRAFPGARPVTLPSPAALLFPRVGGPESTVGARPAEEAFEAFLGSSALGVVDAMPGAREHLALLGEILRGARALDVRLGADLFRETGRVAARIAAAVTGGPGRTSRPGFPLG